MYISIFIGGLIIGLGIILLFNYFLNKKLNVIEEYIEEQLDVMGEEIYDDYESLRNELQYLETIITILDDEINYIYESDEIEIQTKNLRNQIRSEGNIDEILDKINENGISSLSDDQREFLKNYKNKKE
jgi:hypothetical protein